MTALIAILTNTPWWVFLLLALLVVLGVQSLKPRRVALARVFITPAVFIAWGLVGLWAAVAAQPVAFAAWLAGGGIGAGLAFLTVDLSRMEAEPGAVRLPGSRLPLVRNLLIFAAKYIIRVAMARRPDWHAPLVVADMAVSGVAVGYFAGWTLRFVTLWRRALRLATAG